MYKLVILVLEIDYLRDNTRYYINLNFLSGKIANGLYFLGQPLEKTGCEYLVSPKLSGRNLAN